VISRTVVPAEHGLAPDCRCLGVAVGRIVVCRGPQVRIIEADDARLSDGYHAYEPMAELRWTNGDARVPPALLAGFAGPVEVVLHISAVTRYPDYGEERMVA